ncbi:SDR family NAD(P)-dependent oxidoreductase [Sphingorhabdus sp. 109]|uniref:SDR family NAD(P)-dependent oxidoreductase n=1 Tax=Sphingorhabdus sp. 109 TaxID=2653173 RepID=UPI0012F0C33B|nr:SDR family oxidoreductase [Sphingorhabdus sp. 109]VWX59289.1 putative oxidoreductase [Sphingorhabdus sp. 109]
MKRLSGKTLVMTGGGGSIGSAAALRCAQEGANLVLSDIREEELNAAAEAARKAGAEVLALVSDTRNEDDCAELAAKTVEKFGRIDMIFSNAGEVWVKEALQQDKAFWTDCLELELTGQWLPIRAALPTMIEQQSGSVLVSSSMTANVGIKHIAAYSAAKGALQALMKTLAVEHGRDNIRFNSLAIGSVEGRHIIASNAMRAGISYEQAEAVVGATKKIRDEIFPLGRMGNPEDIAPVVAFFASDDSSWVTGTNFYPDGGLTHDGTAGISGFNQEQLKKYAAIVS